MSLPKICFFVPFYPLIKGGAEYQSKLIATELLTRGYEIIYISGGHEVRTIEERDGFKVYELCIGNSTVEKLSLYRTYMNQVTEILVKERPLLIYQRILNTFSFRLSQVSARLEIPFVLHIADNYSLEFNGLKGIFKKYLLRRILKTAPSIICQTDYQASVFKTFNYNPSAIIPNMHPVITNRLASKDTKLVVWIGNARPVKKLEVFLDLAESFKGSDYQFHVIGKIADTPYGEGLREQINIHSNVIYHGAKDNIFINQLLQKSGLLVNTSVSEGFSNTFIQAWMSGTPVLALNSDPDNTMSHFKIGLNCEGNREALKKGLSNILSSEDYLHMCYRSLEVSNQKFSVEKNISRFIDVIEKRLNEKKS